MESKPVPDLAEAAVLVDSSACISANHTGKPEALAFQRHKSVSHFLSGGKPGNGSVFEHRPKRRAPKKVSTV